MFVVERQLTKHRELQLRSDRVCDVDVLVSKVLEFELEQKDACVMCVIFQAENAGYEERARGQLIHVEKPQ